MRGNVEINEIFILKWTYYFPKGGILNHRGIFIFWVLYPIISSPGINFIEG